MEALGAKVAEGDEYMPPDVSKVLEDKYLRFWLDQNVIRKDLDTYVCVD